MEARTGRDSRSEARCAARQRDRPRFLAGDALIEWIEWVFDVLEHRGDTAMLRRFSANHTHLYPGARLRRLDTPSDARLSSGDEMLVEFSDGVLATGRLLETNKDVAVLQMPGYRTQRGTNVAARAWRLVTADEPGLLRVQKRLPAA